MQQVYLECISLVERLHRRLLDVIKAELDALGVRDINNVQSLLLFNIGGEEVTVGDLMLRGYYLGSNVSYNVKKLVETGYLLQQRSLEDRRSIQVRLSAKGSALWTRLDEMMQRHSAQLTEAKELSDELQGTVAGLRDLERFWSAVSLPVPRRRAPEGARLDA